MTVRYAACDNVYWRYEPAPKGVKCQLLSKGRTVMLGPATGKFGVEYIAWAPFAKRDKKLEKELGL